MGFSYNVNVLNQKGSPAIYTDTFANRPAFGFAGRLFIANDTAAIYEDTGTAWVLIANVSSGAGTLQQVTTNGNTSNVGISVTAGGVSTNSATITSLTTGSVPFVGAAGLITQDNANLFFDDTNNRLGINTNTPGNSLDVHNASTNPTLALNNTAGNQSAISFLNTSVSKWRIGNTSINTFEIHNFNLTAAALTIDGNNQTNLGIYNLLSSGLLLKQSGGSPIVISGYTTIRSQSGSFGLLFDNSNSGVNSEFVFVSGTSRTYTYPNASGTIALTSDLTSGYLPLSGGTLTGPLSGTILTLTGAATKLFLDGASGSIGQNGINFTAITGFSNAFYLYNGNSTGGAFGFHIYDNTSAASRLSISNAGNVLIGSTTDDAVNKLQVTGTIATKGASGYFVTSTSLAMQLNGVTVNDFQLNGGGNFRVVNQAYNAVLLDVTNAGVVTLSNLAGTGSRAVLADASGNLSAPVSDISVKENIERLKYGLDTIMKLNAVQFEFIEGYKNYGEGLQIGAIAQEVEQIIPEAVFKTPSTGLKGIDYNQFNGIYIKAIQDQQKIIESLIQRIELLENK